MNSLDMNYLHKLPKPFMVLAPMDDVTDTVFRQIIAGCAAPDLYFTEFVNVDGLQSPGRLALLKKLQFTEVERPLIAQLWGKRPENYLKTVRELVDMGFDGIDINMGCPVKTVIKNGACAALINNWTLTGEIIGACRDGLAGRLPLSVKTRLGFNDINMGWVEFLLSQDLDMLTIHGRTAKQQSAAPANWQTIGEIRKLRDARGKDTLIVGNGDVRDRAQGLALAERWGVDGSMIGRGIFHDPFAFAEQSLWLTRTKEQKIELYRRHVQLFLQTWGETKRPIHTLNKFCKIYIQGFDGARELREELMNSTSINQIMTVLDR